MANSLFNYTEENRKIWSDMFYKCFKKIHIGTYLQRTGAQVCSK